MAKRKTVTKKIGPDHISQARAFFDNIIEDASDKTVTAARIVDGCRLTLPSETPDGIPSKEHPLPISQSALITFRGGDNPGKHIVKLILTAQNGVSKEPVEQTIEIPDLPNGGANIKAKIGFLAHGTGLFLLDVHLDGKLMTRMPFMVTIERGKPPKPAAKSRKAKTAS